MAHEIVVISQAQVTIDGVPYGDPIDTVTATPTSVTVKHKGVTGRSQSRTGKLSWDIALNFSQDFTEGGLTHLLVTRHGETAEVVISPVGEGTDQPTITATCTLVAPSALGGKVDEVAVSGATFGVDGQPAITWAPAPVAG